MPVGLVGLSAAAAAVAAASDNGLGKTPPMGFNSWNHFSCSVTADLLRQVADDFVRLGLRDAGYRSINTDDCWSSANFDPSTGASGRGKDGRIIPAQPFGNSTAVKALVAYIQSKGCDQLSVRPTPCIAGAANARCPFCRLKGCSSGSMVRQGRQHAQAASALSIMSESMPKHMRTGVFLT